MDQILIRFRTMRTEMDALIAQMEALGIKADGTAVPVAAKKGPGRPKKEKVVESTEAKTDGRRKPMTEEHKAKLKAGREAAKARRDAEKAASEAASAAGGADDDVIFEEDEEAETPPQPTASKESRKICRKCVVNLKYGTDHRRCFFGGVEEGLWSSSNEWTKDCEEFAKRFAPESE